jgi:hypothetical protein
VKKFSAHYWVGWKSPEKARDQCAACGAGRPSQYVVRDAPDGEQYPEVELFKALCHKHRLRKPPPGSKLVSRREFREMDALKVVMEA